MEGETLKCRTARDLPSLEGSHDNGKPAGPSNAAAHQRPPSVSVRGFIDIADGAGVGRSWLSWAEHGLVPLHEAGPQP